MIDFISLKDVKRVAFRQSDNVVKLSIQYHDNSQNFEYAYYYDEKYQSSWRNMCVKYQDIYSKITNALTSKRDFVEIEL